MNKPTSISLILLLCALLMVTPRATPQTGYIESTPADEPTFDFSYALFQSDSDEEVVRIEVYYKVYNNSLQYFRAGDQFVSTYEVSVIVYEDDEQVTGFSRERKYRVGSYEATQDPSSYFVNQMNVNVPKGDFKVVCNLTDKHSGKVASHEREVKVDDLFRDDIDMSGIELVYDVLDDTTGNPGFQKGEKQVIPLVSSSLSGEAKGASFYVEIYNNTDDERDLLIEYKVEGEQEGTVYKDRLEMETDKPVTRLIKQIPAESLVPDSYKLVFELKEKRRKTWAKRETRFEVDWSLNALVKNDFERAVEQLKYIASGDEMDELEELKEEDFETRQRAFNEFWAEHDRYPATPENESKALYYARIRHANKYFSVVNREGWETDRGRIYVIFGEPDHVERYPFELSSVPYQVWHYYSLSRTFVFEDTHHTGDYYLTYPYDGRRGGLHEGFDDFDQ